MDFETYVGIVLASSRDDWITVERPIGLLVVGEQGPEAPNAVATYRRDLSIQMAEFNDPSNIPFREDWLKTFPDPIATRCRVHLLWNGSSIFSQSVLNVDGGRCFLPVPSPKTLEVSEGLHTFVSLVDEVFGGSESEYPRYFKQASLKVLPGEWPSR
jgi:hypothetical protein